MAARLIYLETTTRRSPLGLRFIDLARSVAVADGLSVVAWRLGTTGPLLEAERSPLGGIYGFRSLPGLRAFEVGERPASDWCEEPELGSPPAAGELPGLGDLLDGEGPLPNWAVAVMDRERRFDSMAMLMCLPRERLVEVPLFSGPARSTPSGQAVLRGQVWDRPADAAAAWALVTARVDTGNGDAPTYAGLADENGIFALFMPYASPPPPLVGSPPHGTLDVDELSWPLSIEVFYDPARQRRVVRPEGIEEPLPPDIRSILYQRPAVVYDRPGISGESLARPLRYNQELIVFTEGLVPPQQSRLLVDPS